MSNNPLKIGQVIEARILEIGMSKAEFGRRMNTSRQNVNTMLNKEDMGIITVINASKVLKMNFFLWIQDALPEAIRTPIPKELETRSGIRVQVELDSPDDLTAFETWWRERKG